MLAIARALMSRPKLLLLDEPSLGLAPIIVREIFSIIKELGEQGVTILLVEQNARLAQEVTLRLKEAQAAEKANRAKGEFLAHFSHELRTPLNAILGMAEIAKESDSISEIQECLTRLIRNGEVMLEHISGILDISKIESGEMDLDERPFDLPPLVEGVIEGLSLRASERQINISCYIDTSVPKRVKGDAHRVRQILIN